MKGGVPSWSDPIDLPRPDEMVHADYWLWLRKDTWPSRSGDGADIARCVNAVHDLQASEKTSTQNLIDAAFRREDPA